MIVKNDNKKILITAALPYINNTPHLGHIVGSHLPADIFARYCRMRGRDVLFVGGSDENGTPSELAAKEAGIDIEKYCDRLYYKHKEIYDWFNISYDNFSRTSKTMHHEVVRDFFQEVYKNNYISEKKLQLFYCRKDKIYLPDRYVKGACPNCRYEDAYGDQCEKCGSLLETKELVNPKCTICGSKPVLRESSHLFLRLDKLSDEIEKWLNTKKDLWKPQVLSWAKGWIKEGLKPRCITRDLKHGVRVPLVKFEDKVLYVWFDAPIGYISATKEIYPKGWESFWKEGGSRIYHFLGKDNIPFHTIFWPAMLIAHGKFNLPYNVVGLQFLNYGGEKFSKSKKKGVFCEQLMETGIDSETIRAYLVFLIPEVNDTEFKWDDFQLRINTDIIGNYANFINRTLSFIYNKLDKRITRPLESQYSDLDRELIKTMEDKMNKVKEYMESVELRKAFIEILSLSKKGNQYFDYNAPWDSIKKSRSETNKTLYLCANLSKILSVLIAPFLPITSQKIWHQLNLTGDILQQGAGDSIIKGSLPTKHIINKPSVLFNKMTEARLEELKKSLVS